MATSGNITAEEYRTAIRAVLDQGQSYTLPDGRTVTNANMEYLEQRLEAAIRREARSSFGMMRRVSLGRPE